MITEIWYSVRNGGDGSAYPVWMESEELAELDQKWMDESWGECCNGCLKIESQHDIKVLNMVTVDDQIKEIEEDLNEDYMKIYKKEGKYPEWVKRLEGYLADLKKLKEK